MTLVVFVGAFFAFKKAEAPTELVIEPNTIMALTLTSPAFEDGGMIPSKYTCDGENISPELHVSGIPEGTKSLVLVMDDPDIPDTVKQSLSIEKFNHWAVYNINPDTKVIAEGTVTGNEGLNSGGSIGYMGSCPPDREHRYFFRLYAVSGTLTFIKAPTLDEVEIAAQGMSLGSATLMGRYERKNITH